MAKQTPEEERKVALKRQFTERRSRQKDEALSRMTDRQRAFLNERYGRSMLESEIGRELTAFLAQGGKPSVFFAEKLDWLFETGYIPAGYKPALLWAADQTNEHLYGYGWSRRSFRAADYSKHLMQIYDLIDRFRNGLVEGVSTADALNLRVPEDMLAYVSDGWYSGFCPEVIAYALDSGDKAVEEAIRDIFCGEGKMDVRREIILGVLKSHNAGMHTELCKLLKAARLQEGLRQAICEQADDGTAEGFLAILNAVQEDDLIRFSSVKRSVGVWTGLLTPDAKDLERISGKTLELMQAVLGSEEARQAALSTEDSMQIYMALWAYGFRETEDALRHVQEITENGTHHQLLTAGYFTANIDQIEFQHRLAKKVLLKHGTEQDIAAIYLPYLAKGWIGRQGNRYSHGANAPDWSDQTYFASREEAEQVYSILKRLLDALPKKDPVFSPCVFPWYAAVLRRTDLITRMGVIASIYADDQKTDDVAELLPQVDADDRGVFMRMLLWEPRTEKQRTALTAALCDKSAWNREEAFIIIRRTERTPGQYRQMEELLRYKAADARNSLIKLLLSQDDTALLATIERLLADKKEEKRTAGLDLVLQVCGDEKRVDIAAQCRIMAAGLQNPSGKEQVLLAKIAEGAEQSADPEAVLFSAEDVYTPAPVPQEFLDACKAVFLRYYPDSEIFGAEPCTGAVAPSVQQAWDDLKALDALIDAHREDEFQRNGETFTPDCETWQFYIVVNGVEVIPMREIWENWYDEQGMTPERLERMCAAIDSGMPQKELADKLLGKGMGEERDFRLTHGGIVRKVLNHLCDNYVKQKTDLLWDMQAVAYVIVRWVMEECPAESRYTAEKNDYNKRVYYTHFLDNPLMYHRVHYLNLPIKQDAKLFFDIRCMLWQQTHADERYENRAWNHGHSVDEIFPEQEDYIRMAFAGEMTERQLMHLLFEKGALGGSLTLLSRVNSFVRDDGIRRSNRYWWRARSVRSMVNRFLGKAYNAEDEYTESERALLGYTADLFDKMCAVILPVELHRGDTETRYSGVIRQIERIYGMENLIAILTALGKDTIDRGATGYGSGKSKRLNLSHLLSVCVPDTGDNAGKLREMLSAADITEQRLIETALYSPEWLPIIAEYLEWPGFTSACYYFMAHMNESFDDTRKALIARYTPLTPEELQLGAFDIDWFRSALSELGEKRFAQVYDAAKYISDGAKHGRARKYADAAQGKLDIAKTESQIADKRNKDLLMAYALIPLENEDALMHRYLYIVQYRKEAAKFGAQRSASERKAADTALRNLASNAGFADVTRLTLRMETKLAEDSKIYFEGIAVDDITAKLVLGESGEVSVLVEKKGKALKSIPAKYKKNADIVAMQEAKKQLTEQHRRTRAMFEQAMEEESPWKAEEISTLMQNPVAAPILKLLVFGCDGKFGFFGDMALTDAQGNRTALKPEDALICAHPFALRQAGVWEEYQRYLFENKLVQPFRQVFRELYIKTDEEKGSARSLRYAGNQIQPKKTAAVLKSRRWIADAESGLQKIFYEQNLVAVIYALADWFSPADIEAPTLEYVVFYDRRTGKERNISEIPDVLFSEAMRDVDLAVSVGHAGGVDPETSHSTVEMRAALLNMTAELLKLENVKISGSHAQIHGTRGDYTVHLGSGVVHKRGGAMLNILPVHSQQRGRIFLPFADDDPKTAEILSKIILLSEDSKIQDPSILSQL